MKSNRIFITFILPCFILFSSKNIFAQNAEHDSSFYQKTLANTSAIYHKSFGSQSALYNGSKYSEYLFAFKEGQPFFYADDPVAGSVFYDGILYDSVTMLYDEIKDVLVINEQSVRIQLLAEKVEQFTLFNSDFIRLEKDNFPNSPVSTGFYNVLYKGKVCLLKKQIKIIREEVSTYLEVQRFVDNTDHYYIKKDDRIYQIKSSKELLNLFEDRKKEVQQFIKTNQLSFRKDPQNMLTKATAYYDSLK